jgi:isoleucyl-tRNA synthetase
MLKVREAVSRELERLRNENQIGSGLAADVDLYCEDAVLARLNELGDELRFVFITSEARAHPLSERPDDAVEIEEFSAGSLFVVARPSQHDKCTRCWHRRPDIGGDPAHPEICGRCVVNVDGGGEERRFA